MCLEPDPLVVFQQGVQGPVFLGHEIGDLLLPVRHQAHGHGLDPSGGEAPADLFPQQRGQLIAHDAVQDTPGLLGVHQVLVNVPGLPDALGDHLAGDLVEGDPEGPVLRQVQQLLQMPADGLSLPVRVGGQIHGVAFLGRLLQVPDDVLLALDGPVIGLKIVFHVHAQLAFGQVPQMSHTGLHLIRRAQVLADGLGLGRGLHDLQHRQRRQHPPHRQARLLRRLIRQKRRLRIQHPNQRQLIVGKPLPVAVQVQHRQLRRGRGFRLRFLCRRRAFLLPGGLPRLGNGHLGRMQPVREPAVIHRQNVPARRGQSRAVPDQPVAAHAGRRVDGSRHGEHVPPLVQGGVGGDQRPGAHRGFHHQRRQAQPADDAVAHGKMPRQRLRSRRILRQQHAGGGDIFI